MLKLTSCGIYLLFLLWICSTGAVTSGAKRLKLTSSLLPGYFDSSGKPRVCELFAGLAVMGRCMMTLGFALSMVAECAKHLHGFLSATCGADVAGE